MNIWKLEEKLELKKPQPAQPCFFRFIKSLVKFLFFFVVY